MSDFIHLASQATAIITPHLPAITAYVAGEAGKAAVGKGIDGAFDAAKSLWDAVSAKFAKHPKAEKAASDLTSDPTDLDYQSTFASKLAEVLAAEPDLVTELKHLLESPIVQRIVADDATVRDTQQIATSVAKSRQEIIAHSGAVVERVKQQVTDGRSNP
ncbi:hypothetical protein CCAX7_46560 [Capsulimonas corticalis]|uniref:Uncharacterized protein n=1 Tax=Capsulimonas corticalis TaxID=2219043 RepID=A0A402D4X4_9BACT|nr:hypothetical protein [Capsulimonas corticalis]BDI32605.1 hypothetical protein CCAX7_46560 [Capsulimonas corticalis]